MNYFLETNAITHGLTATSLQQETRAVLGIDAKQIQRIADSGLHFQMIFDDSYDTAYILSISGQKTFKLRTFNSVNSASANNEQYMLQTLDGRYLESRLPENQSDRGEIVLSSVPSGSPKSNFAFKIYQLPNGTISIYSEFNKVGLVVNATNRGIDIYGHHFMSCIFNFVPYGNQLEWSQVLGDTAGLGQIARLSKFSLPFYLLAVLDHQCLYDNIDDLDDVESSKSPPNYNENELFNRRKTFTLIAERENVSGNNDSGYMLYGGDGRFLCVKNSVSLHTTHKKHDYFGGREFLTQSFLVMNSDDGLPACHMLFDFVPRSVRTFAIRSRVNGKFVRHVKISAPYKDLSDIALAANFLIDAECAEEATEFIALPIDMRNEVEDEDEDENEDE